MMKMAAGDFKAVREITGRISGESTEFESYGTAHILKADGEWRIDNQDLITWSYVVFFGERDYFEENEWVFFGNQIHGAIKEAHAWQTLQRYKSNGGLRTEHRKLLAKLIWGFDPFRFDGVCLYVGGKRPFGNSSIDCDMM
jgi:hypothetical protein